jgi:SAM-dependent methyltransferase
MIDLKKRVLSIFLKPDTKVDIQLETSTFDEKDYLAAYPDVAAAVESGAIASGEAHFNLYGFKEGRSASGIRRPAPLSLPFPGDSHPTRRDKILSNLKLKELDGLEIGALSSPLVTHDEGNIFYVDHVDTETLLKKYGLDPSVDKAKIVHVDAVWGKQSLQECIGKAKKVDYVVASHVIEHVPDLVTWLAEIHTILRKGGSLRLAVPDRRYTFDYIRNESRLHDVLDAYIRRSRAPLPRMIMEHFGNIRIVDCAAAWAGKLDNATLKPYDSWSQGIVYAKDALENGNYHDTHCWIFTPLSFADLCGEMAKLDLLNFECDYCIETPRNELEFYVSMSPSEDKSEIIASWTRMTEQLLSSKTYQQKTPVQSSWSNT